MVNTAIIELTFTGDPPDGVEQQRMRVAFKNMLANWMIRNGWRVAQLTVTIKEEGPDSQNWLGLFVDDGNNRAWCGECRGYTYWQDRKCRRCVWLAKEIT